MYACIVEKRILNDDVSKDGYTALCYQMSLEQVPVIGQELQHERWFSGPLLNVIWDIEHHCFYARVADERPYIQGSIDFDQDWIIQHYLQQGWVVCER